jgi:hypothetical protein
MYICGGTCTIYSAGCSKVLNGQGEYKPRHGQPPRGPCLSGSWRKHVERGRVGWRYGRRLVWWLGTCAYSTCDKKKHSDMEHGTSQVSQLLRSGAGSSEQDPITIRDREGLWCLRWAVGSAHRSRAERALQLATFIRYVHGIVAVPRRIGLARRQRAGVNIENPSDYDLRAQAGKCHPARYPC